MARARQGKIARLPHSMRDEVNRRLADGQRAEDICDWVNAQPEAREIFSRHFDGADLNPQNVSAWRDGGFADWQAQNERETQLRNLSEYAYRLAQADRGQISAGAGAIAAGKILEVLELVADGAAEEETGTDLAELVGALAKLRAADLHDARLREDRAKRALKEREVALAERRFETLAVETFLKWAKSDEARKILETGQAHHIQAARLRELMFGSSPTQEGVDAD